MTSREVNADTLAAMLKRWLDRGKTGCKVAAAPEHGAPALALERYARINEFPCGNPAVLNPGAVENLKQLAQRGRGDMLDSVVRFYRSDAPSRVEAMKRALESGDTDALRRAAHTLEWISTNIGATALAECCMRLEKAARELEFDPQTERWLVLRIESLLGTVLAALDTELVDAAA